MKIFTVIFAFLLSLNALGNEKRCGPSGSALELPGSPQGYRIYQENEQFWVQTKGQLYTRGSGPLKDCPNVKVIPSKIKKIVVLSSTYLPWMDDLGLTDKVVGVTSKAYVASPEIHQRLDGGKMAEVGFPASAEKILSLAPDLVITYRAVDEEIEGISKLHSLGLNVLELEEFTEEHPLARGSWLLFLAALLGDKKDFAAAMKLWQQRVAAYAAHQRLVKDVTPVKVLVGSFGENAWNAPAAGSDLATLLADAKGDYVFASNQKGEALAFEKVLQLSRNAQVWLTQNQWTARSQIAKEDARYELLPPYQKHAVYNYSKGKLPGHGFDYWETGIARPDLVLMDLILILHGNQFKGKETKWYQKLE